MKVSLSKLPAWLFIDAVRYAMGRSSYQVSMTTGWIIGNWHHLPIDARTIIVQDVEKAFERGDNLGMDCDRKCWEDLRELWTP